MKILTESKACTARFLDSLGSQAAREFWGRPTAVHVPADCKARAFRFHRARALKNCCWNFFSELGAHYQRFLAPVDRMRQDNPPTNTHAINIYIIPSV
jgi:hypothetical protein